MRLALFIGTFLLLAPAAWSADPGVYRPGPSYLSVYAQTPDQCQSQCQGDAMCKIWNYVQVANSPTGAICEFKARISKPIPSQISISGENPNAFDSVKIIPAGHRTTRVGSPAMQYRSPSVNLRRVQNQTIRVGTIPIPQPAPAPVSVSQTRHNNVAMQQRAARPHINLQRQDGQSHSINTQLSPLTNYAQSPPPMVAQRPAFRHTLDTSAPHMAAAPILSEPRQTHLPPAYEPSEPRRIRPHLDNTEQNYADLQSAPTVSAPIAPSHPRLSEMAVAAPPTISRQVSEISNQRPAAPIESGLAGGPVRPSAQNSLFGSLYDDVKAPHTLQSSDVKLGPDAPIQTVDSVPVGTVDVSPL